MDSNDKEKTVKRHLRGAARFEQRQQNEAERKQRGLPRPSRRKESEDEEDFYGGDDFDDVPAARPSRGAPRSDRAVEPNARVSAVARTQVEVLGPGQVERSVRLTPRVLALGGVVVGDEVEVDAQGRVVGRAERRTVLQRRSPGQTKRLKILAANVDVGLVVLAPRGDALSLGFLDRAIVALQSGGITPIVVVTKMDLLEPGDRRTVEASLDAWAEAGIATHFVSSPTGEGIEALGEELVGQVSVVLGHSGVGKSTLVNALDPGAMQDTGATREADSRGRHTTTSSRLIPWVGGALVDTPGIRQLAPDVAAVEELALSIPELAPFLGRCRFHDCAHAGEPGCALEAEAGESVEIRRALVRLHRLVESQSESDV